jgi:FG-GAP-like repeat
MSEKRRTPKNLHYHQVGRGLPQFECAGRNRKIARSELLELPLFRKSLMCRDATPKRPCLVSLTLLLLPIALTSCRVGTASSADVLFTTVVIHTGGDLEAVAVADVDHDGTPDIIAANLNSRTVTVLLGDVKRHFHPASGTPFPAGHLPHDIGIGDFNGDGNLDLLIPNHQTPYVTLLLGDGKGGFRPALHSPFVTHSHPHPHGVVVGHFCGNDKPLDAVIDRWGSEQIELLLGDGKGNLTNGPMFPAGPDSVSSLRSADLDKDGTPDIVMPDTAIGRWNSNTVSVLLGDRKCSFHPAPGSPFAAGAVPRSVAVGDFNNDGNPDLVSIPYGPEMHDPYKIAATVLLGDGKGGLTPMRGSPFLLPGCASPYRVAIADVNGDGIEDFVVTCMRSDRVLLFLSRKNGAYQIAPVNVPDGRSGGVPAERGVALADLTGSGKDDIIVTNGSAGTITVFFSR